jgi:hypothetical protein
MDDIIFLNQPTWLMMSSGIRTQILGNVNLYYRDDKWVEHGTFSRWFAAVFMMGDGQNAGLTMESQQYGSVSKPCTPGEHQNSW